MIKNSKIKVGEKRKERKKNNKKKNRTKKEKWEEKKGTPEVAMQQNVQTLSLFNGSAAYLATRGKAHPPGIKNQAGDRQAVTAGGKKFIHNYQ